MSITPIPLTKLSVVMNNFNTNTLTHLNKLSVKGDEKLAEFDQKLNDLDVMTTLLEAKLNSLPEKITSGYLDIPVVKFDDLNPKIIQQPEPQIQPAISSSQEAQENDQDQYQNQEDEPQKEEMQEDEEEEPEKEGEDLSPEEALENFLQKHENFRNIYKMLKMGVPPQAVEQKVKVNALDLDVYNELLEKAKKVLPNLQ